MTDYSDLTMTGGGEITVRLGTLLAMGYDSDERLHLSAKYYPIFDENHRPVLNRKIVAHYAMREIGLETPEMFCFALGRRMNEIMPYYNQLYTTELAKIDPFSTMDILSEADNTATSESSAKSRGSQSSKVDASNQSRTITDNDAESFHAENPQTASSYEGNATTADKTTSHAKVDSNGAQHSTTTADSTQATDFSHQTDQGSQKSHTKGFSGLSQADLLARWRSTLLNIDMMVVNELSDLFLGIWGTADDAVPYHVTDGRGLHW